MKQPTNNHIQKPTNMAPKMLKGFDQILSLATMRAAKVPKAANHTIAIHSCCDLIRAPKGSRFLLFKDFYDPVH
jgi:hypothetical protein